MDANTIITQAIAGLALLISGASLRMSVRATRANEGLRRVEEARLSDEVAATHDRLGPGTFPPLSCRVGDGAGQRYLIAEIAFPRTYRIKACSRWDSGRSTQEISLDTLAHAGQTLTLHIEHWPDGKETPYTRDVLIKLWPPIEEADDVVPWACPCARPTGETLTGPGHWELALSLSFPTPPQPWIAYG